MRSVARKLPDSRSDDQNTLRSASPSSAFTEIECANDADSASEERKAGRGDGPDDGGSEATSLCWQRFTVPYEFPVVFTRHFLNPENHSLLDALCHREPQKRHRLIVFVDDGVLQACPTLDDQLADYCATHAESLELICPIISLPGGERIKADGSMLERCHAILEANGVDRHSFVIAIGGGAVLDAIGLVAATAHRGIRHVRVPTTVLSQNDSGVGVKNGINQFGQKNWFGTFAPPWAVINDNAFLDRLNEREKRAGMAEAVKVALIRDAAFFEWLCDSADRLARFDTAALAYLVKRCAQLHMRQIGQGGDPFELGSARPLDFGHWAAHRLESLCGPSLRHGEAVAIGLALDTRYSHLAGLISESDEQRVYDLLSRLGFTLWHDQLEQRDLEGKLVIVQGLVDFQAHLGGELTITLLASLGVGLEVHTMDATRIEQAIGTLKARA